MHLGTNQKPIKCHGEGSRVSSMISEQAQVYSLWNLLLKGEVMLQRQCYGVRSFKCSFMICNEFVLSF
jgi:hypothetical protein